MTVQLSANIWVCFLNMDMALRRISPRQESNLIHISTSRLFKKLSDVPILFRLLRTWYSPGTVVRTPEHRDARVLVQPTTSLFLQCLAR